MNHHYHLGFVQSYQSMRELELLRHHPLPPHDFPSSNYLRLRVVVIKYMADIVRELRLCRRALHLAVRLLCLPAVLAECWSTMLSAFHSRLCFALQWQPHETTPHSHMHTDTHMLACTCLHVNTYVHMHFLSFSRLRTLTDWRIEMFQCTASLPSRSQPFLLPSSLWNVTTKFLAPMNCASKRFRPIAFASLTCSTWKNNCFGSEWDTHCILSSLRLCLVLRMLSESLAFALPRVVAVYTQLTPLRCNMQIVLPV